MTRRARTTRTLFAALLLIVASVGVRGATVNSNAEPDAVVDNEPRKLRKLHMVRPDLIPFPVKVNFYC